MAVLRERSPKAAAGPAVSFGLSIVPPLVWESCKIKTRPNPNAGKQIRALSSLFWAFHSPAVTFSSIVCCPCSDNSHHFRVAQNEIFSKTLISQSELTMF